MKKLSVLFFILSVVVSEVSAQTFPSDRTKFAKQLLTVTQQSATQKDQEFIKNVLSPYLLSEANMSNDVFNKMVETCNLMDTKKLRFYPDTYQYVYVMYIMSKNKVSQSNYDNWHKIFSTYLEGKTAKNAQEFLTFSYTFFDENTLSSRSNFTWKYIGGTFEFKADKNPSINLTGGKLVCYLDNRGSGSNFKLIDSIVVKKTEGVFLPMDDDFKGKGGMVTWEKVGLAPDKVFAEFTTPYKVNTRSSKLTVDTVSLTTPQFKTKVKGVLSDVAYNINREADKVNPQFRSFEKNLKITAFVDGVDYVGGFKYEGADFIGSGVGSTPARLTIYNKSKAFIDVYADVIINNNTKIFAENARMVIHLSDKDSIIHQGLRFEYMKEAKSFEFTRDNTGLGMSPFVSNYHNLNMYIPKIVWKKDDDKLQLTYGKELSEELKVSKLESFGYFSKERYAEMQGMASIHPLVALYNYCYKYDEFNITEAKFAAAMNRTIDQCKELLVTMNRDGYIIRDTKTQKVIVTDKVKQIIETNQGKSDYDNIVFVSDLRMARMPAQYTAEQINRSTELQRLDSLIRIKNSKRKKVSDFGTLNLQTLVIGLNAVDKIDLSESKFTTVSPDNEYVEIGKNRNFVFKGWLKTGKMEIEISKGNYDYASNSIKLEETKKILLVSKPLKKEDGDKMIYVNSFISGAKGTLYVDDPNNRSGLKQTGSFPKIDITNNAKVLYNDPLIYRGVYDSTRFYFTLKPFKRDSLLTFSDKDFRLAGELTSAGIFPKFEEQLKIMPDYSLGFTRQAPQGGFPFYETKAKYENKIMLSNSGLQGSGKIEFVKSISESTQFTFLPDSTIGMAKFTNVPSETGVQFPDVNGKKANISYNPRKQYMNVYTIDDPLLMFKDIQYLGKITVTESGITGNGLIIMPDADLNSKVFKFTRWKALATTADFRLKNSFVEEGEGNLSLVTTNVDADLDFKERRGIFKSNKGETKTQFPLNNFYCLMDKFTWTMDDKSVLLENTEKERNKDIDISAGLDLATPNFFSTNPKQDSLSFRIPLAKFSLKEKTIFCQQVEFVDIADARIFPSDKKMNILRKGVIEKLENAKIIANYVTKYHTIEQASANILARRKYEATGKYPYVDAENKKTYVDLTRIYVDSSFQTIGLGEIKQESDFKLSSKFDYYGKIKIAATNPLIDFNGATRINHECNDFARSWMAFSAPIDPKNIQIPVSQNMKTLEGEAITAGLVWRDARNPDSVVIYPAFLSKLYSPNDNRIILASGILQYNPSSKEFQIASAEKLLNRGEKGNYIALHTQSCSLNGDGKIELGMNYGDVEVTSYGVINYDNSTKAVTMNLTSKFNFPKLDKSSFEKVATKIIANESLRPLDLNTSTLEQATLELKDKKTADAVKNEFIQKGAVKNLPKEFEDGITITNIQLKSFYNGLNNGLVTAVGSASIVNIFNKSVFKQVPFKAYMFQAFSGNVTGDKLQFDIDIPGGNQYFFDYGMEKKDGKLQIYTSDEEFEQSITAIKEDKRKERNFMYEVTPNSGIMSKFLQFVK